MSVFAWLPTFLAVVDAQGFGRAARRLGVRQPTVSYRIRELEAALGTPVLERGRGRFLLTPAGTRLARWARDWLQQVEGLQNAVVETGPALGTPLRIAAVSGFGRYVLFPAIRQAAPSRVALAFRTAEEVLTMVRSGDVDAGYVYVRRASHLLRFDPVYEEEIALIVPVRGLGWRRGWESPASAGSHPFVTYEEHDYVFGHWFMGQYGAPPSSVRSHGHFDELEEVIDAVADGWGASVVPWDAARRFGGRRVRVIRPRTRVTNTVFLVTAATTEGRHPLLMEIHRHFGRGGEPRRSTRR